MIWSHHLWKKGHLRGEIRPPFFVLWSHFLLSITIAWWAHFIFAYISLTGVWTVWLRKHFLLKMVKKTLLSQSHTLCWPTTNLNHSSIRGVSACLITSCCCCCCWCLYSWLTTRPQGVLKQMSFWNDDGIVSSFRRIVFNRTKNRHWGSTRIKTDSKGRLHLHLEHPPSWWSWLPSQQATIQRAAPVPVRQDVQLLLIAMEISAQGHRFISLFSTDRELKENRAQG